MEERLLQDTTIDLEETTLELVIERHSLDSIDTIGDEESSTEDTSQEDHSGNLRGLDDLLQEYKEQNHFKVSVNNLANYYTSNIAKANSNNCLLVKQAVTVVCHFRADYAEL